MQTFSQGFETALEGLPFLAGVFSVGLLLLITVALIVILLALIADKIHTHFSCACVRGGYTNGCTKCRK